MRLNMSASITNFGLAGVRIHRLIRSGLTWKQVVHPPTTGEMEYSFNPAEGKITFGVAGPMAGGGIITFENITVIYEI